MLLFPKYFYKDIKISTTFLNNINVNIPYREIYSRLGYRKSNEIKQEDLNRINKAINEANLYCVLKGVYNRLQIVDKTEDSITLSGGVVFKSKSLSDFLKESNEVFLMGITAGGDIMEYRDSLIKKEELFLSVIADAVGSEIAEEGANWMQEFLDNSIKKQGLKATRLRYSPGYGDFEITNQNNFFNILELDKLDLRITESCLLIPEKTVTAVIGIIKNI